MLFYCCIYY